MLGRGDAKGEAAGSTTEGGLPPLPERLLEEANDSVIVTEGLPIDEPGPRVVYVNAAFSRTTGYSYKEIIGKSPRVLQGPGTDRAKLDEIRAALAAGRSIRTEVLNYRKDGEPFWVELDIVPVRGAAGRLQRWLSVQRETTARVEAEEARLEAERRLRSVLARYGSDMVTILEPDGAPRYESPAVERALGYKHKELADGDVFRFVHPDDVEKISRSVAEALETPGESPPVEFRMKHADGSWRWFESVSNNLSHDPDVGGIVVVTRDVTARKEAEDALRESQEWFRILVQNSSDVITILEADGSVRYQSPAIRTVLGRVREFLSRASLLDNVHPDDAGRAGEALSRVLREKGLHTPVEFRARHADGSWRHLEAVANNLLDEPGVRGIVVDTRDVTERKRAEAAFAESEARLRTVARGAPVVLFALDAGGVLTFQEGAALRDIGLEPGEHVGRSVFEIYPAHPEIVENVRRALSGEEVVATVELDGRAYHTTYSPQRDERGTVTGLIGVATDVTERRRLEEELRHRAFHDDLTGLPNRALFFDRLEHALEVSRRDEAPTSLLYLDLDGFKAVNDAWGHETGDEVLIEASRRVKECVRPSDTVARLGGDEFGVVLERCPPERAEEIARRIEEALTRPFRLDAVEARVSASVGRAHSAAGDPGADTEAEEAARLLGEADRAMYRRKKERPERFG